VLLRRRPTQQQQQQQQQRETLAADRLAFIKRDRRASGSVAAAAAAEPEPERASAAAASGGRPPVASMMVTMTAAEEHEALDREEAAFRRASSVPIHVYQNQTLQLCSATGTPLDRGGTGTGAGEVEVPRYPSALSNVGMPAWSLGNLEDAFPQLNQRPQLALAALQQMTSGLSFEHVHFDLALRGWLQAFDLRTWLDPTKLSACLELFCSRYVECNRAQGGGLMWAAWESLLPRLAMEIILLHGHAGELSANPASAGRPLISASEFIAACGASESGNETRASFAKVVRAVYQRVLRSARSSQGLCEPPGHGWDACYTVGPYPAGHDERALLLRSQIELQVQGQQLLATGWTWAESGSWVVP
jgi:hypothetical protein